jgi:hypothetical protein
LSFQIAQAGNYDVIFGKQQANTQLNAEQLELIHDFLRLIARPIEDARRLKDMPRGRFPVVYTHGIIDAPQTDYRCAINVADLLRHHAYDLAHDGKMVEAIHACQACLNTGRAMREDFFVMAFLARCSCQWSALSALDRVLAQGEVSEDTLKPTQSLLEKESKESGWLNAMRGERAYLHSYAEGIRAGNIENCLPGVPPGATPRNLTEWISEAFPSTKTKYCPDFLRQMTEYVEIAKLPIHRRIPRAEQWAKKCSDSPNPVICVTGSIYAGYHRYEIESQARLRAAVVATACERYRLRHQFGLWPITLDMLVDEKLLDAIPLDPTDGKPLRYRKTKDNILIYSQGVDIGFRLWNVDRRRQPALPPVKLEN